MTAGEKTRYFVSGSLTGLGLMALLGDAVYTGIAYLAISAYLYFQDVLGSKGGY